MFKLACAVRGELQLDSRWKFLVQMFQEADSDGNGVVDRREFQAMLAHLDVPLSAGDEQVLMGALDKNGDGVIDYREFVDFLMLQDGTNNSAEQRPASRRGDALSQSAPDAMRETTMDKAGEATVTSRQATAKHLHLAMEER